MKNKTKEEISALVSNELREMDLNGVFNEDSLNKIQEKVSARLKGEEKVIEEEVIPEQENEGEVVIPTPSVEVPVVTPNSDYEPELPIFMEKIEPAKFVIFDMNEVSLGGEQLSNKPFRLYSDPDTKKSIHDTWKEEGKRKGEIYIAKFEKIGNVEFDYKNGTSHFTEKRFENAGEGTPSPVYQENPYATQPTPQEIDNKPIEMAINNAVDVEDEVKNYVENILRRHFSTQAAPETETDLPIEDEVAEDTLMVNESDLKYREIIVNDKKYTKIDTPKSLKESIKSGKGEAKLLSKNKEVQTWVFEGVEYYLPIDLISINKCHKKNTETL